MENKNDKFEIRRVLGRNYNNSENDEQAQEQSQLKNASEEEITTDKKVTSNNFSAEINTESNVTSNLDEYISQIIINNNTNNSTTSQSTISSNPTPQSSTPKLSNSFFQNHPYLTLTIIIFILFAIISGITENSNNNQVLQPQYETAQTNNIQPQTTTPTKEVNKEVQTQKEPEQKTINKQPEVKEPEKKIKPVENKTIPKNKYSNPDEYLVQVKRILQNSYSSNYSVDCTLILTPQGNVNGLKGNGNDDVAYNFLNSQSSNIPKFVDSNGKTVPLLIKFSGHSIESVKFQYAPIQSAPKKPVQTQSKQNVPNKSDLQKTSDWFFE